MFGPGFFADACLPSPTGTCVADAGRINEGGVIPAWPGDSTVFRWPRADKQLNGCLRECDQQYSECKSFCGSNSECRLNCRLNVHQCYIWGCLWPAG